MTNSSSSSFIFGEPKGNIFTYQRVYDIFWMCCTVLINSVEDFKKYLAENDRKVYSMVVKSLYYDKKAILLQEERSNSETVIDRTEDSVYNLIEAYNEKSTDIMDKIYEEAGYRKAIEYIYKKYDYENLGVEDIDDFLYSFDGICLDFYRTRQLYELKEDIKSHIIDFHSEDVADFDEDIDEILSWFDNKWDSKLTSVEGTSAYYWRQYLIEASNRMGDTEEDKAIIKELRSKFSYNALALEHLGEVAILGYEETTLPELLNDMLKALSTTSCIHMG